MSQTHIDFAKPGQFIQKWPLAVLSAFSFLFLIKRKSKREADLPTDCFFFFDKPEKQHNRDGEREILLGFSRFNMQIFQQRNHSR